MIRATLLQALLLTPPLLLLPCVAVAAEPNSHHSFLYAFFHFDNGTVRGEVPKALCLRRVQEQGEDVKGQAEQDIPYGVGAWQRRDLGNHRACVSVDTRGAEDILVRKTLKQDPCLWIEEQSSYIFPGDFGYLPRKTTSL